MNPRFHPHPTVARPLRRSAEGRQELRDVLAAVSSLPDRQRDAIVMRELEGRSYDEIASRLGASPGAVRQLPNRARGSLRDRIRVLVPVEPFVRWALSRSSGANAAGGATLSGACVLGAKVCVVALLPATVALVPSPPTPRHTTVTRGARPTGASGPTHATEVSSPTHPTGVGGPTHPTGAPSPTHLAGVLGTPRPDRSPDQPTSTAPGIHQPVRSGR